MWLVEGMASLYELPDFDSEPGQVHGKVDFRRDILLNALKDPKRAKRVSLDGLLALGNDEFRDPEWESLSYAVAREAMRWLDSQGRLWAWYSAWRDGVLGDISGEKAFEKVMGETSAEGTEAWVEWLNGARPGPK